MATKVRSTSSYTHELNLATSSDTIQPSHIHPSVWHCFEIENKLLLGPSNLFFTRDSVTNEHFVIKMLSQYQDARYSLETVEKRQQCQLEALYWNKAFTSETYIGLGRICVLNQHQIILSEIIDKPDKDLLDPHADYALLMRQLPKNRRLDSMLDDSPFERYVCIQHLAKWVAYMHQHLAALPITDTDEMRWGSCEQLLSKLQHNLELSELILKESKTVEYNLDDWLNKILSTFQEIVPKVFTQHQYQQHFERRRKEQRIKRCHGDLKIKHIWIASNDLTCDEELWQTVRILDAIDFNPIYCNIDILSDIAMLAVDIQAHTSSPSLADQMIEEYLHLTKQQDEIARAVLDYYLVEKALVSAIVQIVYGHLLDPGLAFLRVAEMRLGSVKHRLGTE